MRRNDDTIRPMHYVDRHGHDLFYEFESGNFPAIEAISFCHSNVVKYERRAGKKTPDPTEDLNKARTYFEEYGRLLELRAAGKIHDQGLELILSYDSFKQRQKAYLKRLDRIEEDIKSGRMIW